MTNAWLRWGVAIAVGTGVAIAEVGVAGGQIVPDDTLGAESSTVSPTETGVRIDGGALRGGNLFHSFEEFSVPTNREALFDNNLDVRNIFSRVTGNSMSEIDGLLRANGTANLFLLNPNGIIFGPNARLDLGGSFFATTANSVAFENGLEFSATNPENSTALLSINVPLGVQFNGNPGAIQGTGAVLNVPAGEALALVGGAISLSHVTLEAPGGRVELGGASGSGTAALQWRSSDGGVAGLQFPTELGRSPISLTEGTKIAVAANGGGDIAVRASDLDIRHSILEAGIAEGGGFPGARAGAIALDATGTLTLTRSNLSNLVRLDAIGDAGSVRVAAHSVTLRDGATLESSTRGRGNAGTVTVDASDRAIFTGRTPNGRRSGLFGTVDVFATGNAGNIRVRAGTVTVSGGAVLDSRTFGRGNAGTVIVEARDTATFAGSVPGNFPSGVFSSSELFARGDAGDVIVRAKNVLVTNGAQLDSSTLARGNSGTVRVEATDTVRFAGTSPDGFPSGAFTIVHEDGIGDGGNIQVRARTVDLVRGAIVSSSTFGRGDAGRVTVEAVRLNLDEGSIRSVARRFAEGNAGGVEIAAESVSLGRGSEISTRLDISSVEFTAGEVFVRADSIQLSDDAKLSANTQGRDGNVRLDSRTTILRHGSTVRTNADGNFPGGNITLDTGVLAALNDSDITANARNARGGRVAIDAQGIFGTQFRNQLTPDSDITATSELGAEFSGTVELNTPDIDTTSGLVDLAANPVDAAAILDTDPCATGRDSEFYITGREGLPPNPEGILLSEATWVDWRSPDPETTTSIPVPSSETAPLVEAQGWHVNAEGQVVLSANIADAAPNVPQARPVYCSPRNRTR